MSRMLRPEERELISHLLAGNASESACANLPEMLVEDMRDGGMGSIRFLHDRQAKYAKTLCEAQALDSDGVVLSIALNADTNDKLMELDIWKVDFSPLKKYPDVASVHVSPLKGDSRA